MRYYELIEDVQSRERADNRMRLGPVSYDQVSGIGNVPLNQEVLYRGLAVAMKPRQFSNLARFRDFSGRSNVDGILQAIDEGRPIGSPFLMIEYASEEGTFTVTGHEGRTRVEAIRRLYGEIPVLVHLLFRGLRGRDFTPELIEDLRMAIVPQEMSQPMPGPWFGEVYR